MSTTLQIIVAGCLLGMVQLAVGVALGMWLRRSDLKSHEVDVRRARSLALELHGLTQRMGGHVAEHRARFEAAGARLREVPADKRHPTTDLVVGVVSEILAANRQLQAELVAAENQIAEQARDIESHLSTSLTDPLTNLPNRRALDEQLAIRLDEYRKFGTPFSLLMLDIDHFKQINDTFGHPVGDDVLVAIASALRGALRKHDFVARYGGEEFAIIFPHTTLDEAERAAIKAGEGIEALGGELAYLDRRVTASGGLASLLAGEAIESLVRRADQALYMAKRHGRNRNYLHDGHQCLPFAERPATKAAPEATTTAAVPPPVVPSQVGPAELAEACDRLRAAMLGVVAEK